MIEPESLNMKPLICFLLVLLTAFTAVDAQDVNSTSEYKSLEVVWSGGLFKSWLKDNYVGFNKIGNSVTPVFEEQYKMGFRLTSHYMYKPIKWFGIGIHMGLGLDVNSYIEAPMVLFGGSISLGNNHQFLIDFGWSDGKRRKVPGNVRNQLEDAMLTEVPDVYEQTDVNTGFYLGIGYRI